MPTRNERAIRVQMRDAILSLAKTSSPRVMRTAFKVLKELAESGESEAKWNVAICYDLGEGVRKDRRSAAKWYREAARDGCVDAIYNLGVLYERGTGVVKSYEQAATLYREAAREGFAGAEFNLGCLYLNGNGVTQNARRALHWFQKAAIANLADAQFNLGIMYEGGAGIRRNLLLSIKWYSAAVKSGDVPAMTNLGWLLCFGTEEIKSPIRGMCYLRRAWARGDQVAAQTLARCYRDGVGVKASARRAQWWSAKSLSAGKRLKHRQRDTSTEKRKGGGPEKGKSN